MLLLCLRVPDLLLSLLQALDLLVQLLQVLGPAYALALKEAHGTARDAVGADGQLAALGDEDAIGIIGHVAAVASHHIDLVEDIGDELAVLTVILHDLGRGPGIGEDARL